MRSTLDWKEWISGLPNKLTLARIASIPFLIFCFSFNFKTLHIIGAIIFLAAALTDFFDGFIARKYQLQSSTGALLDPIADKLLVMAGLILLVPSSKIIGFLAIMLLGRDLAVSGLRMIALEQHFNIEVNQYGKLKTAFQVAGIFMLMIGQPYFDIPFFKLGMVCLWISLFLSLYSGYGYWQNFRKHLV